LGWLSRTCGDKQNLLVIGKREKARGKREEILYPGLWQEIQGEGTFFDQSLVRIETRGSDDALSDQFRDRVSTEYPNFRTADRNRQKILDGIKTLHATSISNFCAQSISRLP